jgi:release factor glutamine methyltransferase
MKKSEIFTIGLEYGLSKKQIESVVSHILEIDAKQYLLLEEFEEQHLYEMQKAFYKLQTQQPEEYVYKKAEFYGNDFYVDERVLIPRNETEILVSQALKYINMSGKGDETTLIDVGTGSACIPISIALSLKPLKLKHIYAIDISPQALQVAKLNLETYHLSETITLSESSLLEWFTKQVGLGFSGSMVITANLPYIKDNDFASMDSSVIKFEPNIALFGGKTTGFELYETLIKQCYALKQIYTLWDIAMFLEIWFDQFEVSQKFLWELWLRFEYFLDTNKIKRIIKVTGF